MQPTPFIGIDPDSQKLVCCLKEQGINPREKIFPSTVDGVKGFINWMKNVANVIVAIEGRGGYSTTFEQVMTQHALKFYSIAPGLVHSAAITGPMRHKSNSLDAAATADAASSLHHKGQLEHYLFVPSHHDLMKLETRMLVRLKRKGVAEYNQLWQLLGYLSNDVRLFLCGDHKDYESSKTLANTGVLKLLCNLPAINTWQNLSDDDLHKAMGLGCLSKRKPFFAALREILRKVNIQTDIAIETCLSFAAESLLRSQQQHLAIQGVMKKEYGDVQEVKKLMERHGIGVVISTGIVAEIGTIDRFSNNDHLASYAGFGRRQYRTGSNSREIKSTFFNHRLKDLFMQAAHCLIYHKGDNHLLKYFEHLRKKLGPNEAYKRVARAYVRIVFRELKQISVQARADTMKERSAA